MDGLLRDKLLADGLANGVCKPLAVARDHSLRKHRYSKYLERQTRPKKHSHGQPGTCVTMKGRKCDQKAYLNIKVLKDGFDGVN